MTVIDKYFNKYEHLPKIYASKLFSYSLIGFTKDDVIQELNVKLITALSAYGRAYLKFQRGESNYPPMPLEPYLKMAMLNRLKDLMRKIQKEREVRVDGFDVEIGIDPTFNVIDFAGKEIIIGEIDLLAGFNRNEKALIIMFLKGYPIKALNKITKGAGAFIKTYKKMLLEVRELMLEERKVFVYQLVNENL